MASIFLILSGVILAAGVLYWFWSHIQLTQKKVQLLESAVFELRGLLTPSAPAPAPAPAPTTDSVETGPVAEEDWNTEEFKSTPLEHLEPTESTEVKTVNLEDLEDLQPGGGAKVGEEGQEGQDGFRELFIQHDPPAAGTATPSVSASAKPEASPESLDAMPVRELRRLAEQRGLTNVSDMRKKELLSALRQQVGTVTVERTVDLEEIEA
jgi:hypothetical protein